MGRKHTKAMVATWVVQMRDSLVTKSYGKGCELWLHWLVSIQVLCL